MIVGDLGSAFGYDGAHHAFREVMDGVRASGIEPTETVASIAEVPSLLGC